jgi:hypothetical protein
MSILSRTDIRPGLVGIAANDERSVTKKCSATTNRV